jgi:hypothetical protein
VNAPPGEDYRITPYNAMNAALYVQYDGARRIYDRLLVEMEFRLTEAGVLTNTGELTDVW